METGLAYTNMSYMRKALRGVSYVAIVVAMSHVLSYVLRIVFARSLSPKDYGLFSAVIALMMFFLIFRDLGMSSAVPKFIAQYNVHKNYSRIKSLVVTAFVFQFLSSLTLVSVVMAIRHFLAQSYFQDQKAVGLLAIVSAYVIVSMLTGTARNILQGFQETKWYPLTETMRVGFTLAAFPAAYYANLGVYAPAIAYVAGVFMSFLILTIKLYKYRWLLKYPVSDIKGSVKELFAFAVPVIFTGIGNKVVAHLDVLILTYFAPLAVVGVYEVILPTALMFLFIPRSVTMVLFPMASELWAQKDNKRLTEGVRLTHTYLLFLTQPLVLIVFAYGEEFIQLFFGTQYTGSVTAFRILLTGVLFYVIAASNHSVLSATGNPIKVTRIIGVSATVNILLNLALIPKYEINGAAIATCVSYLIAFIMSSFAVIKLIEGKRPWDIWVKSVLCGTVFATIMFAAKVVVPGQVLGLVTGVACASLVYTVCMVYILKVVSIKEIMNFAKVAR